MQHQIEIGKIMKQKLNNTQGLKLSTLLTVKQHLKVIPEKVKQRWGWVEKKRCL